MMSENSFIGIGLRHPHYQQVLEERPAIGWFEVHSVNFFAGSGASIETLSAIREHYPLSLHGVGLSLGSASGILEEHLNAIKRLIHRFEPFLVSEHLSWSRVGNIHMPDLLPIPYTDESLEIICRNVFETQEFLGRELLIENPSSYIEYNASELSEVDFLVTLCQRTGAKILLDVNNIFVSCTNHDWNAYDYIDKIPKNLVKEIHLAGHSIKKLDPNHILRVDTHDHSVCQEVWDLYGYTIQKTGAIHTLLEWDAKIPELHDLINEAAKVKNYLPQYLDAYEKA